MKFYSRFGEAVRICAIQHRFTLGEIADGTDYSRPAFNAAINGKTYIHAKLVHELLNVFNLSETERLGLAEAAAESNRDLRAWRKDDIYFTPEEILNDNSGDS